MGLSMIQVDLWFCNRHPSDKIWPQSHHYINSTSKTISIQ